MTPGNGSVKRRSVNGTRSGVRLGGVIDLTELPDELLSGVDAQQPVVRVKKEKKEGSGVPTTAIAICSLM